MAKIDWQLNDVVLPSDMNLIGEEINSTITPQYLTAGPVTDTVISLGPDCGKGKISLELKGQTINVLLGENFASGTGGFTGVYGTIANANNKIEYTVATLDYSGRVEKALEYITGDTLYIRYKINPKYPNNTRVGLGGVFPTGINAVANTENSISFVITTINNTDPLRLYHDTSVDYIVGDKITFDDVMVINLTQNGLEGKTKDGLDKMHFMTTGFKSTPSNLIFKTHGNNYINEEIKGSVTTDDQNYQKIKIVPKSSYYFKCENVLNATSWRFALKFLKNNVNISNAVDVSKTSYSDYYSTFYEALIGSSDETIKDFNFSNIDADEIWIKLVGGDVSLSTITDNAQLGEGLIAADYKPYQESIQYIVFPQDANGLDRIPSGVYDEAKNRKLYKRTSKYVLQSGDIDSLTTSNPNLDRVVIGLDAFSNLADQTNEADNSFYVQGFGVEVKLSEADLVTSSYKYSTGTVALLLLVPKGTYADLAAAQSDLAGITLVYQLAEPVIYELENTPLMTQGPNTAVIIEPVDGDWTNFVVPEATLKYSTNPASERESNSDGINHLSQNQIILLNEPSRQLEESEVNNIRGGLLASGNDPYNRISGTGDFFYSLDPLEKFTIKKAIGATGKKYFNVTLQGSDMTSFGAVNYLTLTTGVFVHGKSGQDGYHQCTGSMYVTPSAIVDERYTSGAAWRVPGIDASTEDNNLTDPVVGEFDPQGIGTRIYRGCGAYQNNFYSCITDSISNGLFVSLLGIYIEGADLCFVFKNRSSSSIINAKTQVRWEVW